MNTDVTADHTARLVGRQRELAQARAVVDAGLAGAGVVLLVNGEAGIGKTTLVEELAAGAPQHTLVLWGSCWADPGTPSLWPWRTVVQQCAAAVDVPAGDDVAPLLGAAVPASGPADQLRLRLFAAVAELLRTAARVRPLLVVLEDLHVADDATLELLRFVAAAVRGQPLAVVATYRYPDPDASAALAGALAELGRLARTVTLFGLDRAGTAQLVHATTGQAPDEALANTIHERTGGNPLFVVEVARLLAAGAQLDSAHVVIPPTVQQVIGQRLAHVGDDVLDVLAHAAVIGQVFSFRVLREVTGVQPARVLQLLDDAVAAGLVQAVPRVGDYGFTHALVRDVLYAGMPMTVRRARHRRTAEAIERLYADDLGARAGELADHYVLALPDADPARALDYSRRAGRGALERLAYAEGERHLARAVDLADAAALSDDQRVELLLSLGDARLRTGDWQGASAVFGEAAASARRRCRPRALARAALGLGAGLSGFEVRLFDQRQLDLLREALEQLPADESRLRAWVLARLSVAESYVAAEDVRIAHSAQALQLARQAGDPKLLAYALSSYSDAIAGPAHTDQRLALADEMVALGVASHDAESELLGRRFRVVALLESGDVTAMAAEVEAFERTSSRLRWPLVEWYPPLWRATRALIEGRLADAEQLTEAARRIGQRGGSVNADIVADVQRLQWLLERGQPAEAYELLGRFLTDPEGGPNAEAWRALPLARMGRDAEARAVVDSLAARGFPLVMDAAWLEVVAGAAQACAELAHDEAARALLPLLEPYADRFATGAFGAICFGSLRRHLGLLAHRAGHLDDADRHFRRALAAHRRAGATLLVAHTLREHAALLADRDEPGDAASAAAALADANGAYRQLGLDHWVRQPVPAAPAENVLRRDGDVWTACYDGREARVRDVKGMAVLARLLAEPDREFHVLDLAAEPGADVGSVAWRDTGDVIDAQARQAYRRRLSDLDTDIEEATVAGDVARAERARRERDALVEQLAAAYGVGGRARRANDPVERARTTVTKQVRAAIARMEAAHPALAAHLARSVRTGRYCTYAPERPVSWQLS